ncbi:hypothetical protein DL93DRAFT_2099672 [Clavulina sp. PMI_390]|nr:hypothetical protein DL93DRAFT_2099672 [Clavulina sp. PMI_390]
MAVWADLPSELATNVLHELDPVRYKTAQELWVAKVLHRVDQTLLSCTYVSHQFRAIIEPLLYRQLVLSAARDETDGQYTSRNLQQFTRALVLRPELANHVRELDISSLDGVYGKNRDIAALVTQCNISYDEERVHDAFSAASKAARDDLLDISSALAGLGLSNGILLHGGGNGVLIVLLHLLPRLQKLEITARSQLEFVARSSLAAFTGGIPLGLKLCSKLMINYDDTMYGYRAAAVVPFLALPSITELRIGALAAVSENSSWLEIAGVPGHRLSSPEDAPDSGYKSTFIKTPTGYALPARSSSVKNLAMMGSVLSCLVLNKILSVPFGLERFEYSLGGATVGYEPFRPAEFLPGLLAQSSSLRELVINTKWMDEHDDDELFIGSLSGMTALASLHVPAGILLGPSDGEGALDNEQSNERTVILRNPIDERLPSSLVSLQLELEISAFESFRRRTGLPKSLRFTRQRLPLLMSLTVGELDHSEESNLREILRQKPALQPPIKTRFFLFEEPKGSNRSVGV